ncbi:MAG: dUTP diphosphatase [Prevotella sp.]|nr:dUTP diphosphatase [Prevotella sp.]
MKEEPEEPFVPTSDGKKKVFKRWNMNKINIMLDEGAKAPTRAHEADAGLDIYALEGGLVCNGTCKAFRTGLHVQIPQGYVGILFAKSGLNVKHGITSTGVIDSGYTGEIIVNLHGNGGEHYQVKPGDKISQLVILPIVTPSVNVVDSFDKTDRGDNGFGSSGR